MQIKIVNKTIINTINDLMKRIENNFADIRGRETARKYITGLMSNAERKNGWQLSEALGFSTPYLIQQFIYRGHWNAHDLRDDLRDYVKDILGDEQAVLVVDETGFLKKGTKSAGVKRQYSGTAGRIENCQVGVFLTYAAPKGYGIIDRELYLPEDWMDDKSRCKEAGIPEETVFQTKPQMALQMLKAAYHADIPFAWVTADCVYGDYRSIGTWLESISKNYVLAVSGKSYVWQGYKQRRVSTILKGLPEENWERHSAGRGSKGERFYDWMLIPINDPPVQGFQKNLLVRRSMQKPDDICAYVCFHPEQTTLEDLVKTAGTRWTVEQCFEEAKGEAGLDHYEVRSYNGWYKHITLSCLTLALLAELKIKGAEAEFQEAVMPKNTGSLTGFKKGRNL